MLLNTVRTARAAVKRPADESGITILPYCEVDSCALDGNAGSLRGNRAGTTDPHGFLMQSRSSRVALYREPFDELRVN